MSSNNEEDTSPTLLGGELCLSLEEAPCFELSPEQVLQALTLNFEFFEGQALVYFAGYIAKKNSEKFHSKPCNTCSTFSEKVPTRQEDVEDSVFFTWLKKYDDNSNLHVPSPDFTGYVRKVSQVTIYCFKNFMSEKRMVRSVVCNTVKFVWAPDFCCISVKEKTVSLIVRTIVNYRLKWLNDRIHCSEKNSKRKLKKMMHK